MKRVLAMLMISMMLAFCFTGCAIIYVTETESDDKEVTEFGLLGGECGNGLIPLYREIERYDDDDDGDDGDDENDDQ